MMWQRMKHFNLRLLTGKSPGAGARNLPKKKQEQIIIKIEKVFPELFKFSLFRCELSTLQATPVECLSPSASQGETMQNISINNKYSTHNNNKRRESYLCFLSLLLTLSPSPSWGSPHETKRIKTTAIALLNGKLLISLAFLLNKFGGKNTKQFCRFSLDAWWFKLEGEEGKNYTFFNERPTTHSLLLMFFFWTVRTICCCSWLSLFAFRRTTTEGKSVSSFVV